ncbi:ABC transporter [Phytophthora infestans]|uniref:ABC transporter n=1 Tax=Phytophthora infestans TaxID=4787 RepID=A0A8S9V601_PHYIN|nr:ABC transporter [Phytophthora infestans]
MRIAAERQLAEKDIWELDLENQTRTALTKLTRQYENSGGLLLRAVLRCYGLELAMCGLASIASAACELAAPVVLHHVLEAFTAPQTDLHDLCIWLGLFFASRLLNALLSAHLEYYVQIIGLRATSAIRAFLFLKSLRSSSSSSSSVEIMNLFTSDMGNITIMIQYINSTWVLPLQIGAIVYMLYWVIGLAAFAGLALIVLCSLLVMVVGKMAAGGFMKLMQQRDRRMKVIQEVFGGIQVVKLNVWEKKFSQRIEDCRSTEVKALKSLMLIYSIEDIVVSTSPLLVSVVSLAVYSIGLGETLTAAKVFTALALFNALRSPLQELPCVIQACFQANVSLERIADPTQEEGVAIDVQNGTLGWNTDTTVLNDVNFQIKRGDLAVVHGAVGSGKSSLCYALLGEMQRIDGRVFVRGKVVYYSQQPWIQNLSIRDNILFGHEFDEAKYGKVLEACGLVADMKHFPSGDLTEIGEKGVNLSGGQKARVSLARACYADADVYKLDSPLAAVDAAVRNEIFGKCICGLLGDKTVLLVTHSRDVIRSPAVNYIVRVEDGTVHGERLANQIHRSKYAKRCSMDKTSIVADIQVSSGRFVVDEERQQGRVTSDVFWIYFKALGGAKMCVLVVVSQLLWQAFQIGSDFWLSHWTSEASVADNETNMEVYALLGGGGVLMVLLRSVCVVFAGLRGARYLFGAMTDALMHAPMKFFDTNPIGRIVNRYTTDIGSIDFQLPLISGAFLADFFLAVCQLVTAAYVVNFLGILVVPLAWMYVKVANFYLASCSEITRLQRLVSSPVLSHVKQCEEGLQVSYIQTVSEMWYIVRIQLIGCAVVIGIVSALVYLRDLLPPGFIGLAFTYALNVDAGLANIARQWSFVELIMVSPERVMEYASIAPEGSNMLVEIEPAIDWPLRGVITFQNVNFSYERGDLILKNVSFTIGNNEKVGIVGRTGAGKSSLSMALFRINELVSGQICIDGIDISTISVRKLRAGMSIIPQVPVLFNEPLRDYLDPFDQLTDEAIWVAIDKVGMKSKIRNMENQLEFELGENAGTLSVGERQLLCLARAVLKRSRIVVMDEATSSIDHDTEQNLQKMLRQNFQHTTTESWYSAKALS